MSSILTLAAPTAARADTVIDFLDDLGPCGTTRTWIELHADHDGFHIWSPEFGLACRTGNAYWAGVPVAYEQTTGAGFRPRMHYEPQGHNRRIPIHGSFSIASLDFVIPLGQTEIGTYTFAGKVVGGAMVYQTFVVPPPPPGATVAPLHTLVFGPEFQNLVWFQFPPQDSDGDFYARTGPMPPWGFTNIRTFETTIAAPEPGTVALTASGLLAVAWTVRRRRS